MTPPLPDWYFVALINSEFISLYVDNFINNTSHFQINDARQLPIIIPQKETFESLQKLAADCISLKKVATTDDFLMGEKQYELNRLVRSLYGVEGFCWNNLLNPNARLLKVKLKGESVNDVGSMSLYAIDLLSNKFIVALLNSNVLFDYYREFINCSVNIQVNDIKQLPIIIPTKEFAFLIESLADKAIKKKQKLVDNDLEFIEEEIEDLIKTLPKVERITLVTSFRVCLQKTDILFRPCNSKRSL